MKLIAIFAVLASAALGQVVFPPATGGGATCGSPNCTVSGTLGVTGAATFSSSVSVTSPVTAPNVPVSVKAPPYNAVCDGTTLDDTAINAAIAATTGAPGRELRFPSATCKVKNLIIPVISSGSADWYLHWVGEPGATLLCTNNDGSNCISATQTRFSVPHYTIEHLKIIGPDATSASTTSGNGLVISGGGVAAGIANIRDVSISNFFGSGKACAWLNGPENNGNVAIVATQCDIGIKLTGAFNANNIWVDASQTASYGVYGSDMSMVRIAGVIQSNMKWGLHLDNVNAVTVSVYFENNNSSSTAATGALEFASDGTHNGVLNSIVDGCVFTTSADKLYIKGASGHTSWNNIFRGGYAPVAVSLDAYSEFNTFDNFTDPTNITGAGVGVGTVASWHGAAPLKQATVKVGSYEVGSENATGAFATADLTSHAFIINDSNAKTLTEASCISDAGDQTLTVKISSTTLFSIHCVAPGTYSTGTTNGTTGYIIAASMGSTAVAAHTQLDLSGTANTTTKDAKLQIYGSVN